MITCTIILALICMLIATEADSQVAAPIAEPVTPAPVLTRRAVTPGGR